MLDWQCRLCQEGRVQNDVRAVLQYVPQFRGRLFVVLIEAGKLPESAVAECLLDLAALEDVGVKLVLVVLGGDVKDFYDWGLECEIKVARTRHPLDSGLLSAETLEILARGQVPVVDGTGHGPFDDVIVAFALKLSATKLIALLEKGVLVDGAPIHALRAADAAVVAGGEGVVGVDLLLAAAKACQQGLSRVHVLDGMRQGVLVDELFSNEGVGTMVHADSYRIIRALISEDIPELLGMIGRSVRRSFLVPRNYEEIEARIEDYHVMLIDDNVVGCVALHEYPAENSAEIACLYVKQYHEGRGYGADLVRYAEKIAVERGVPRVFALTNRAADFFRERMGYSAAQAEALPEARRILLEQSGRGSQVFVKRLDA
jgi:amino-acid N-acetyltransferase